MVACSGSFAGLEAEICIVISNLPNWFTGLAASSLAWFTAVYHGQGPKSTEDR